MKGTKLPAVFRKTFRALVVPEFVMPLQRCSTILIALDFALSSKSLFSGIISRTDIREKSRFCCYIFGHTVVHFQNYLSREMMQKEVCILLGKTASPN